METEIWKDVLGAAGKYQVSSLGRVKSFRRHEPRVLTPGNDKDGYQLVSICLGSESGRTRRVHQLVAEVFLPEKPTPEHELNHKDWDKANNRADNLEWLTQQENKTHAISRYLRGENNPYAKLTNEQVVEIHRRLSEGHQVRHIARDMGMRAQHVVMIKSGRAWKHLSPEIPYPSQIHGKGERAGRAILKDADIPVIIERLNSGESALEVSKDYGVCRQNIYEIRWGKSWTHIPR